VKAKETQHNPGKRAAPMPVASFEVGRGAEQKAQGSAQALEKAQSGEGNQSIYFALFWPGPAG
jgi:hypothetical protein